jgi:hypothetical protein
MLLLVALEQAPAAAARNNNALAHRKVRSPA